MSSAMTQSRKNKNKIPSPSVLSGDSSSEIGSLKSVLVLSGECMLLGSVSSQQRCGVTDIKALGVSQLSGLGQTVLALRSRTDRVIALRQISVTALCYCSVLFR